MTADFPPGLEERFRPPETWQWLHFTNARGQEMRAGYALPPSGAPDAFVVALPGLREFCELYFETAHEILARNMGFCVIDWTGQGKSHRHIAHHRQKRHATSFERDDTDDLHTLLHSGLIDFGGKPLIMLAHSMGGHIGLHYLKRFPDDFRCAALLAPMCGILAFRYVPHPFHSSLFRALKSWHKSYIPLGRDWDPSLRGTPERSIFSRDPVRLQVHTQWCLHDETLKTGSITLGWLHEAVRSCRALMRPEMLRSIETPCLIALAGREALVDNRAIRIAAATLPDARLVEFPDSLHEILAERDSVRVPFMESFFAFTGGQIKKS